MHYISNGLEKLEGLLRVTFCNLFDINNGRFTRCDHRYKSNEIHAHLKEFKLIFIMIRETSSCLLIYDNFAG